MNSILKTSAVILTTSLFVSSAFAAANATDSAQNYTAGWNASTTPDLGSGFGAWTVSANNNQPPYVGTYLDQTSFNGSDGVLSSGYAWATYANGGSGNGVLQATRAFGTGGGSASLVNQQFSIGLGSAGIGGSGQFLSLLVGTAFNLSYAGGNSDNMVLSVDGGTANPVGVTFANLNAGITVALTVTGALNSPTENYNLAVTPFSGGSQLYATSGTFDSSTYNTSNFSVVDNNTSGNGFFNTPNIAPVPEPSTFALIALNGVGLLAFFRRRK